MKEIMKIRLISDVEVESIKRNVSKGGWHEGVTRILKRVKVCFDINSVRYWKKGKSYIIFDPYVDDYWCITKKYYDASKTE
jgi:hypothetical protein